MKTPHELGDRSPGEVIVEYVGGARDGWRDFAPRQVRPGQSVADGTAAPAAEQVVGARRETYVRRDRAERCLVDGLRVWHYDFERPVRRARPASRSDADESTPGEQA